MPAIVSMLRAVNVGGHNKLPMAGLRALYASLGLHNPQTYVQSGNVVFLTAEKNLDRLARRIELAIEQKFGVHTDVILRTVDELKNVVKRNPFASRPEVHPGKLLVTFLAADPDRDAQANLRRMKPGPEETHLIGRELYIYFPNGAGQSRLSTAALGKALQTPGTARNWNSVTKLLEIALNLKPLP